MVYSMTAASSGASVRPTNYSASNLPIIDLGAPTNDTDAATKKYVDDQVSGMVTDVQVNGTSVLTNGVANVPVASATAFGAVKVNSGFGISIISSGGNAGILSLSTASDSQVKQSIGTLSPIPSSKTYMAAFYGLAKAAGDTTQSQSSNAVGTYTPEAKAAIQNMLGISQTGLSVVNGQLCITYEEVSA